MWTIPHFNSIFQFFNFILIWSPAVVFGLFILLATIVTWRPSLQVRRYFKFLIAATILFRLGIATLASFLQYAAWSGSAFTQLLLPPSAPWSYFIHYSFTHYWLNTLLSILVAGFLWAVFEVLRHRGIGVIREEESLVALLAALLVGWPAPLVLIPIAFIFSAIFGTVAILPYLEARLPSKPTFEWPLILATPIAILFAKPILLYLGLAAIFA